jgi:hypothetical protein
MTPAAPEACDLLIRHGYVLPSIRNGPSIPMAQSRSTARSSRPSVLMQRSQHAILHRVSSMPAAHLCIRE